MDLTNPVQTTSVSWPRPVNRDRAAVRRPLLAWHGLIPRSVSQSVPATAPVRKISGEKREVPDSWEDVDPDDFSESECTVSLRDELEIDSGTEDLCGIGRQSPDVDWFDMKPGQLKTRKWAMAMKTVRSVSASPIPSTEWSLVISSSSTSQARHTKRAKSSANVRFRPGIDDDNDDGSAEYDTTDWKAKFVRTFSAIRIPYIDSHCHLDFLYKRSNFMGTFAKYRALNQETFPPSFAGCIAVFCKPAMWNDSKGKNN